MPRLVHLPQQCRMWWVTCSIVSCRKDVADPAKYIASAFTQSRASAAYISAMRILTSDIRQTQEIVTSELISKMECLKGEFEYFAPKPFVTQVERSFYREYTPISALQNQAAILFMVPYSDQIYLHLTRSFLYVRAKITNTAGADVTDTTQNGPINEQFIHCFQIFMSSWVAK